MSDIKVFFANKDCFLDFKTYTVFTFIQITSSGLSRLRPWGDCGRGLRFSNLLQKFLLGDLFVLFPLPNFSLWYSGTKAMEN